VGGEGRVEGKGGAASAVHNMISYWLLVGEKRWKS